MPNKRKFQYKFQQQLSEKHPSKAIEYLTLKNNSKKNSKSH